MIFYAYFGYPLCLFLLSLFVRRHRNELDHFHNFSVSLLISAYNEEDVIEEKLANSLELDYPKDRLEIVVVSDGSDDKTNEIVSRYADKGVVLRHYEGRIGKTACLNKAVPLAKGDIIVFSDANAHYDKSAIQHLVRWFANQKIGFVTGRTIYFSEEGDSAMHSVGVYSRIEKLTKKLESELGSCVGADGAIFAIRKYLYQPLNDFDINDFVIPLNIVKQDFRGVMEEKAFCIEGIAKSTKEEFNRQVRITNRTIRAIFNTIGLINPLKFGFFSFELLSHKISKLLAPFFMITILLTNILLITNGLLYLLILLGQLSFYLLAFLGHSKRSFKGISTQIFIASSFTTMNLAILWGWIKYFSGETYIRWLPGQR